jgi:hypothetical protein
VRAKMTDSNKINWILATKRLKEHKGRFLPSFPLPTQSVNPIICSLVILFKCLGPAWDQNRGRPTKTGQNWVKLAKNICCLERNRQDAQDLQDEILRALTSFDVSCSSCLRTFLLCCFSASQGQSSLVKVNLMRVKVDLRRNQPFSPPASVFTTICSLVIHPLAPRVEKVKMPVDFGRGFGRFTAPCKGF